MHKDKDLYESADFSNEFQARDNYVSYSLDKKNKTLYFYYEETYLIIGLRLTCIDINYIRQKANRRYYKNSINLTQHLFHVILSLARAGL